MTRCYDDDLQQQTVVIYRENLVETLTLKLRKPRTSEVGMECYCVAQLLCSSLGERKLKCNGAVASWVSALISGSSGLGLSPGRGHCVVFLGKTLNSHCAPLNAGGNPAMD